MGDSFGAAKSLRITELLIYLTYSCRYGRIHPWRRYDPLWILKDEQGKVLVEFPLTIGVVGALFAPVLAAIGAIAALVTKCTIVVERREE